MLWLEALVRLSSVAGIANAAIYKLNDCTPVALLHGGFGLTLQECQTFVAGFENPSKFYPEMSINGLRYQTYRDDNDAVFGSQGWPQTDYIGVKIKEKLLITTYAVAETPKARVIYWTFELAKRIYDSEQS